MNTTHFAVMRAFTNKVIEHTRKSNDRKRERHGDGFSLDLALLDSMAILDDLSRPQLVSLAAVAIQSLAELMIVPDESPSATPIPAEIMDLDFDPDPNFDPDAKVEE